MIDNQPVLTIHRGHPRLAPPAVVTPQKPMHEVTVFKFSRR